MAQLRQQPDSSDERGEGREREKKEDKEGKEGTRSGDGAFVWDGCSVKQRFYSDRKMANE